MSIVTALMNLRRQCNEADVRTLPAMVLLFDNHEDRGRFRAQLFLDMNAVELPLTGDGQHEKIRIAGFDVAMGVK